MVVRVGLLHVLIVFGLATGLHAAQTDPYDSGGPLLPEQAAYDVSYYELDLAVEPRDSTIDGGLTVVARIVIPTNRFVLDLDPQLEIYAVEAAGDVSDDEARPLDFERRGGKVWIALPFTRQPGDRIAVRVAYGGRPRIAPRPPWDGGFTWARTPSGDPWIATTCFGEGADVWWPVKDHPSDEPDSMRLHITVPDPLVVASNGRLEGVDPGDGWSTYHWFVSTPINNYDVALNIAPYRMLQAVHESVSGETFPVAFWVLPEDEEKGRALMPEILAHLRFYEALLGPYPFRADKYGVAQTPHLGMEHQTIIAYGARFDNGAMTGGVDWGFDALHHHELSHEWWGNLVTNADFKDLWLHEGFGSYMQPLYLEQTQGREAYHAYMNRLRPGLGNLIPVAPREARSADQIYGGDIYAKGAWVLHTLRYLIGEDALRTSLRRMAYPDPAMESITDGRQTRFATTDDFLHIAEDVSGVDLDWFFEVYLRQPELPTLVVEHTPETLVLEWDSPHGLSFPMPVDVRIGNRTERVAISTEAVSIPVGPAAQVVIDPDGWVLKELVER